MPRLTKQVIDATPFPPAGQVFVRDAELSGFALRVTQGRKSFVLEKRIRGRMRRLTIGPYGPLTVEQARTLPKPTWARLRRAPIRHRSGRIGSTSRRLRISPHSISSGMRLGSALREMIRECSRPISRFFAREN